MDTQWFPGLDTALLPGLNPRQVVGELRRVLAETPVAYAGPEESSYELGDGFVALRVDHREDTLRIDVIACEDGRTLLFWLGGTLESATGWDDRFAEAVAALLTGRNAQTQYRRLGRIVAVDIEFRPESGTPWRAPRTRPEGRRRRLLRAAPWPADPRKASISFDRRQALAIEVPDPLPFEGRLPRYIDWLLIVGLVIAVLLAIATWTELGRVPRLVLTMLGTAAVSVLVTEWRRRWRAR